LPPGLRGGHAGDSEALAHAVAAAVRPGDTVLVKGSAGARMGRVVEALTALDHALPRAANGE
jgi:UDP-N-acetylmuramoyl-tripeptide--D-alanyl-D-alanine ligase